MSGINNKPDSPAFDDDREMLIHAFYEKRKLVDAFLDAHRIPYCTCPGCAYPTLRERGGYEICDVCNWEDDHQDDPVADEIWGGPNGTLSLTQNRLAIGRELAAIADVTGGKINLNPKELICILHPHDRPVIDLIIRLSDPSDIVPHRFIHFEQPGQTLIWQLISLIGVA